jgi:hypothetical protein
MPIIHPTLKIDVMKMEQAFPMGYRDAEKAFSLEEKHVVYNQLFVIKTTFATIIGTNVSFL